MAAICTFADGRMADLQAISLPTVARYAARHGHQLVIGRPPQGERPASWHKVPLLRDLLDAHGEVLWIDADVVVTDLSADLFAEVPADAWQALVRHHTPDGEVPNCGVWLCRRTMLPVLDRVWSMTGYLHHGWWEQAAVMELLGYDPHTRPTALREATDLYERTHWLGLEWNSHPWDEAEKPRFRHATMYGSRRAEVMRGWAAQST